MAEASTPSEMVAAMVSVASDMTLTELPFAFGTNTSWVPASYAAQSGNAPTPTDVITLGTADGFAQERLIWWPLTAIAERPYGLEGNPNVEVVALAQFDGRLSPETLLAVT